MADNQRARELQAAELRLDLLAAARWNLRDDRVALGTLSAISQGEGVADLAQDLVDLAALIDAKQSAFESDQTFDANARALEARAISSELRAGTSSERLDTEQAQAKGLRDHAYS